MWSLGAVHSAARNAGVAIARGAIIGFIDDDVFVDPKWAKTIMPHFRDPNVGGVEGRAVAIEGARPGRDFVEKLRMRREGGT